MRYTNRCLPTFTFGDKSFTALHLPDLARGTLDLLYILCFESEAQWINWIQTIAENSFIPDI